MKWSFLLLSLALFTACSQKSSKDTSRGVSLEQLETERVVEISQMSQEEIAEESSYLLVTQQGLRDLIDVIALKLNEGGSHSQIEAQLWLTFDSLHEFWLSDDKEFLRNQLEFLGELDEQTKNDIKLFLQSEGKIELESDEFADLNDPRLNDPKKVKILERLNLLKIKKHLKSSAGKNLLIPQTNEHPLLKKAINELLREELDKSMGLPVSLSFAKTVKELPSLSWNGSIHLDFGGVINVSGAYVPGQKFGGNKNWANNYGQSSGHTFATPNMASRAEEKSNVYTFSLLSEVRGGGKKTATNGFDNKSAALSFDLTGSMVIEGCDDPSRCAPFLLLKVDSLRTTGNSRIEIWLNNSLIPAHKEILIDRTNGPTELVVRAIGSKSHSGKSGAISDHEEISFRLIHQTNIEKLGMVAVEELKSPQALLLVNQFPQVFVEQLMNEISQGSGGMYVFRHLKYIDEIIQDHQLGTEQLNALKVINNSITTLSSKYYVPLITQIIEEKKNHLEALPVKEMIQIFKESFNQDMAELRSIGLRDKLKRILLTIDKKILDEAGIEIHKLDEMPETRAHMASLLKTLADRITEVGEKLMLDINQLRLEIAQINHLYLPTSEIGVGDE